MRQHAPARHVDDRREIDEAAPHRDVGDVHRPDMVGPLDRHAAQEIRVDLVSRRRLARIRSPIERFDPHSLHQRRHMPAAADDTLAPQQIAQHPRACKGIIEMQFVEAAHELQILGRNRPRLVIDRAPRKAEHPCLPLDREGMAAVNHRFALSRPALLSALSKKSLARVSSPILA
jgi:hypothetical protein